MWAAILLFAILLPILIVSALAAVVVSVITLLRRRGSGQRMEFTGVVFAYAAVMMIVGVFLVVSGAGLIGRAAFGEAVSHDFAYGSDAVNSFDTTSDDDATQEDAIYGIVLVLVGALMFAPHAAGFVALGRRGAVGASVVSRGYNLVGLATATIGFLAAGGSALAVFLERLSDESARGWRQHHPGEPLAFAIVLLPVVCWFGLRLWSHLANDASGQASGVTPEPSSL
jgi:hypothetical protein